MDLWSFYDFLVNRVHAFMVSQDQCLYNALVLTLGGERRADLKAAGPELTRAQLLQIRGSALEFVKMIEDEIQNRDEEAAEDESLDESRPVWDDENPHLHVHWCPCVHCRAEATA